MAGNFPISEQGSEILLKSDQNDEVNLPGKEMFGIRKSRGWFEHYSNVLLLGELNFIINKPSHFLILTRYAYYPGFFVR